MVMRSGFVTGLTWGLSATEFTNETKQDFSIVVNPLNASLKGILGGLITSVGAEATAAFVHGVGLIKFVPFVPINLGFVVTYFGAKSYIIYKEKTTII